MHQSVSCSCRLQRLLGLVLLALFCVGWTPAGCSSPCKSLAIAVCQELNSKAEPLCKVVLSECAQPDVSPRRCRALLSEWPKTGRKYIRSSLRHYKKLKSRLSNLTYKRGQKRLKRATSDFRKQFHSLLRFSWKTGRRRAKVRRYRGRRKRRVRKRRARKRRVRKRRVRKAKKRNP